MHENGFWSLPSPLIEASNGVVWPLLILVIIGFFAYIVEHWMDNRRPSEWVFALRPIVKTYQERKGAIAMLWGVAGFELKIFALWWPRHIINGGGRVRDVIPEWFAPTVLILGTAMIVIGFTCWLRVTVPLRIVHWAPVLFGYRVDVGRYVWVFSSGCCVIFGVWMAT